MSGLADQFELAWTLTDMHLSALTDEDFLWEPTHLVWTMHQDDSGRWFPDWAETEPDPIPVPTIGWLSWHILFWWTAALDAVSGRTARAPAEIRWPGPAEAVRAIGVLCEQWRETLAALRPSDLDAPCGFPWGPDAGRTVADTVWWLNVELTKNGSEIGLLRSLRAAR